jgi:hypothetical protein
MQTNMKIQKTQKPAGKAKRPDFGFANAQRPARQEGSVQASRYLSLLGFLLITSEQ